MPAERTRVCVTLNNSTQYYQREIEVREGSKYIAKPYFVIDPNQAAMMSEPAAKAFVSRLRALRVDPWIEDAKDGRRIEVAHETRQSSSEDTRVPMKASLDDQNFFAVRPANSVEGPRWFVRCTVPGRPTEDIIYSETILGALERAQDLGFLQFGERAPAPEPQQPAAQNSRASYRRRPGDRQ